LRDIAARCAALIATFQSRWGRQIEKMGIPETAATLATEIGVIAVRESVAKSSDIVNAS
jgi:hypothetical protein